MLLICVCIWEMNARLLQKIEELTLYTIGQEKKIQQLEAQNKKLERQQAGIEELKQMILELQKEK